MAFKVVRQAMQYCGTDLVRITDLYRQPALKLKLSNVLGQLLGSWVLGQIPEVVEVVSIFKGILNH